MAKKLQVILAGYNVDVESLKDSNLPQTPETISAAYARISRDPASVTRLRKQARNDVKKARKSNESIVYGMSHHSVAEHSIFNFDILGISRRAIEELESFRIGSAYTEKSQRYITLDGDFIMPEEFSQIDQIKFTHLIKKQIDFYHSALPVLISYQFQTHPDLVEEAEKTRRKGKSDKNNQALNKLEGWAKEDARYALSMATEGQLGLSFNGRTLEHAIRKMRSSRLSEVRDLSNQLYNSAKDIAPSLIALADAKTFEEKFGFPLKDKFYQNSRNDTEKAVKKYLGEYFNQTGLSNHLPRLNNSLVNLVNGEEIDHKVLSALIFVNSDNSLTYSEAEASADYLKFNGLQEKFMKGVLKNLSEFDALPREFEHALLKWGLVVSASNFAQLKRHRMMTLSTQGYNPDLGYTIPESIKAVGLTDEFEEIVMDCNRLFDEFKPKYGESAEYILTNSNRRRVLVSANPREVYHISRMREDPHAQWDIRHMANEMLNQTKTRAPLTFMLACGKHEFDDIRNKVYGE